MRVGGLVGKIKISNHLSKADTGVGTELGNKLIQRDANKYKLSSIFVAVV